jgi:dihydroorotate dehydrogenase
MSILFLENEVRMIPNLMADDEEIHAESLTWRLLRGTLFQLSPEKAHDFAMLGLKQWQHLGARRPLSPQWTRHPSLSVSRWGLNFPNPIGLAAGLDKDAKAVLAFQALGFGFLEVGTVTPRAQPGNPSPRLFRLKAQKAIINRMGFNNDGVDALVKRMQEYRASGKLDVPVGINIGKNADTPIEKAPDDYLTCFQKVRDVSDYVVINVSSPNTKDLRTLQLAENLSGLLARVQEENQKGRTLPLLLKLSPDLNEQRALQSVQIAQDCGFAGVIISNTTIERPQVDTPERYGAGGLSGAPLFKSSTSKLQYLVRHFSESPLDFIGVGGIMSGKDALAKRSAGAALLQVYTGFIYGGPTFAADLCASLVQETKQIKSASI